MRSGDNGGRAGVPVAVLATARPLVEEELTDQLLGKARAEGVELFGPYGLLSQVTKAVLERAQAEEMTGPLGYGKHDAAAAVATTAMTPPESGC